MGLSLPLLSAVLAGTFVVIEGGCKTCYTIEPYTDKYYVRCGWSNWSRCLKTRVSYRLKAYDCKCSTSVDGGWTEFSPVTWSGVCSTTCGEGTETGVKTRTCTNPEPAHGGQTCTGDKSATEIRHCNLKKCPIDGGWSDYGPFTDWTECSVSCGIGIETRSHNRTCSNPEPQHGGADCDGMAQEQETRSCDKRTCPDVICSELGEGHNLTSHLQRCTKYLSCLNGVVTVMNCSSGLEWNKEQQTCAYPAVGSTCMSSASDSEDPLKVICTSHGQYLAHETDCHKFYQCVGLTPFENTCQNNLAWNEAGYCDFEQNVARCHTESANTSDNEAADDTNQTSEFSCSGKTGGFYADTEDCTKYYWCVTGYKYHMSCGPGTHYSEHAGSCILGSC